MTHHDLNADYPVKCFSGVTRMQSELTEAFDLVANKSHWKLPIKAKLATDTDPNIMEIRDAIVHFTGSVPTFSFGPSAVLVEAAGYYALGWHGSRIQFRP